MIRHHGLLTALALSLLANVALAEESKAPEDTSASAQETELQAAYQAAGAVLQRGPVEVSIAGQATLKLPEGYGFVPATEGRRLLRAMGNRAGEEDQGLIYPLADENADWFFAVSYINAGYIKDDDARDWNADDLLSSIRAGTEETNKERKARGIPELEIIGWVESPLYDSSTRRLVWSISSRRKGATSDDIPTINYNTLALGREGYVSMDLIAGLDEVEGLKPTVKLLLSELNFSEGKRYADFDASTDKVAEYGLAALVAGVAAKKLGFFALLAAFVAKFAKVIGVGAIAGAAALSKVKRKKDA